MDAEVDRLQAHRRGVNVIGKELDVASDREGPRLRVPGAGISMDVDPL